MMRTYKERDANKRAYPDEIWHENLFFSFYKYSFFRFKYKPSYHGSLKVTSFLILRTGHQIWRFDSQWIVRESYPKSLFEMGLPDSVDYVFAMPSEDALYFFKETNYYKLEAGHEFVGGAQPIVTKFGSAAIDADAAFAYDNGKFTSYMDVLFLEPRGNGGRWVG